MCNGGVWSRKATELCPMFGWCCLFFTCLHELDSLTSTHLKKFSLTNDNLREGQLIAARVGLFIEDEWKFLTVCSHHRNTLGIGWKQQQRSSCHYPSHVGKGKPERCVSFAVSTDVKMKFGVVLPIGTGECLRKMNKVSTCRG